MLAYESGKAYFSQRDDQKNMCYVYVLTKMNLNMNREMAHLHCALITFIAYRWYFFHS